MSDSTELSRIDDPRLIREEKLIPLPATRDGILTLLRRVLTKPYVDRISVSSDGVVVAWSRALHDSLDIEETSVSVEEVIGRISLVELTSGSSPQEILTNAMFAISMKQQYPSFLLVGSIQDFRDWYGIPSMVPLPEVEGAPYVNFLGLYLREVPDVLPVDNVLVLGSIFNGRSLAEVASGVRIVI